MKNKSTNKLALKAGSNILKLMGKANQAKNKVKQEMLQIYKDPTFSLPKIPQNTNSPSTISAYCQIFVDDAQLPSSITQIPQNTIIQERKISNNNFKVRHSSLSFIHQSNFEYSSNENSNQNQDIKIKQSRSLNALQNKYSFLEIAQTSDVNYFITKKIEPEIALFMSGANKVIAAISQQRNIANGGLRNARINLNHISNYILKTNKSLEIDKQRTYEVKFVGQDGHSFELSEKVNFLDSSVSIITPNSPPFSYLFILNLIEEEEIINFAKIVRQIKLSINELDDNKLNLNLSSIITNFPPFRQICQICKKNCAFSIILFLPESLTCNGDKESEKLVNLFCEKKKSFLVEDEPENKEPTNNLHENDIPKNSTSEESFKNDGNEFLPNNDDNNNYNDNEAYFADDSGGDNDDDFDNDEQVGKHSPSNESHIVNDPDETISMISRAESDIKETKEYIANNTISVLENKVVKEHESEEEIDEVIDEESDEDEEECSPDENTQEANDQSSLFSLLKKLNNSEKENKEKLEKINEIHNQLKIMEDNLASIKSRQLKIKNDSANVNQEIIEICKQSEKQAIENEKMKQNVRDMIIRTGQLKSKYSDLLEEIHEKERNQKEKQWKLITEKENEMKIKVSQSESKWRKELENHRKCESYLSNDKENENENIINQQNHE